MPPTVAVVVPTHHRPDALARCLDALAAQQAPAEDVIVVRGADDEAAGAIVARYAGLAADVVSTRSTQVHRMHAGAAAAHHDVVAFTDDDAAPHPDWVAKLRGHLSDPTIGAVGGRDIQPGVTPARAPRRVGAVYAWGRVVGGHTEGRGAARDVDHLRGVNMAVRRSLLRFPTGLRGPGAQGYNEVSLCLSVRAAGHRVVYDPGLLVDHHVAPRYEHGDGDRYQPAVAKRVDEAFNEAYTLLSFHPHRRALHMAYVLLLGDRSTGGVARCTAARLTGDRWLAQQLRPLLRANVDAYRAWRHQPLVMVSPDDPYPQS